MFSRQLNAFCLESIFQRSPGLFVHLQSGIASKSHYASNINTIIVQCPYEILYRTSRGKKVINNEDFFACKFLPDDHRIDIHVISWLKGPLHPCYVLHLLGMQHIIELVAGTVFAAKLLGEHFRKLERENVGSRRAGLGYEHDIRGTTDQGSHGLRFFVIPHPGDHPLSRILISCILCRLPIGGFQKEPVYRHFAGNIVFW